MRKLSHVSFKVFSKSVVFLLIAVLGFSNAAPAFFNKIGSPELAEMTKIKEAMAAISIRATGAYVSGTANLTPAIPAAQLTGDMMILAYGTKPYNDAPTIDQGWTSIGSATDGTVAAGVDVGSMQTRLFYKIATSDTETNPTVTNTTNNVSGAVIIVFQKAADESWNTPVGAGGGDASAGTGFSVTASSNPGITAGDLLVGYAAIRSDAGTQSAITITATGATMGSFTESPSADLATTSGGDMAMSGGYVAVSSGTASAAPVYASTLAASHTGSAFIVRLRTTPNALTIGVTAGSKATTLTSGGTDQYMNTISCAGPSDCAAFTLNVSNTSVTVSSIKITETGTANATADLSNAALFYDTDGNYSNGVTGQYGATVASFASEAATVSGSLALTAGTTYYFYVRLDVKSAAPTYPAAGQTINFQIAANADVILSSGTATISGAPVSMAGTTTVIPIANSTTYGSGLSDGARSGETITISGYGFGVAPAGSRANCAGAVDTGCVRFIAGGSATVGDADVTAWSNTSIGFNVSSTLASYGGASALQVVSGSQNSSTTLTYYIYPNVTSIASLGTNAAREYDSGDTDGLAMLSGDHFGTTQGTVNFTGAFGGGAAAIHATVEGSCITGGWSASGYSGNSVCIEVTSSSISDSVYSGSITLTRNSDSKTFMFSTFYIMPRILSNTPANGVAADVIQILGNHFCQSGTCPVSPNRSDASNNVKFGATQALDGDFVNQTGGAGACNGAGAGWTHTEICVKVPSGVPTGSQPTKVRTNNTYDSNAKAFIVNSNVPSDPTSLNQYKNSALTQTIAVGGMASSVPIYLTMTMEVPGISGGTLYPQIEYKTLGTAFTCAGTGSCASAVEGNGKAGPGPWDCSVAANNCAVSISPADGDYHWQARVCHNKGGAHTSACGGAGDYSSNWVSFGGNFETEADFKMDTAAPVISNIQSSNVQANSATITWSTNEAATSQVQYNKTGTFVNDCSVNGDCTTIDLSLVTNHPVNLSNLDSGTTYYYRVRSKDQAGNEAISGNYTFVTSSVTQPAKTTRFYVAGVTAAITNGSPGSFPFSVFMTENATSTISVFAVIRGIYDTSGGTPSVTVQANSETAQAYNLPPAAAKSHFTIIHKISAVNIDPSSNTLSVTPDTSTSVYIVSADVYVTYAYSP